MTDRLDTIKRLLLNRSGDQYPDTMTAWLTVGDAAWLIAEVERLENKAIYWEDRALSLEMQYDV